MKTCKNCSEVNKYDLRMCRVCKSELPISYTPLYVETAEVISIMDWLLTYLLLIIPGANLIQLLFYAFKSPNKTKLGKSNVNNVFNYRYFYCFTL